MKNSQTTITRSAATLPLILTAMFLASASHVAAQPDRPQTATNQGAPAAPSNSHATKPGPQASTAPSFSQPTHVSVLDVGAKLAVLVLAVWGITWGIKTVRRNGITFGNSARSGQGARLRDCASLSLGAGPAVHIIEVDQRPIVVATNGNGGLKLLLELQPNTDHTGDPEQNEPDPAPNSQPIQHSIAATLQQDNQWQKRRQKLVQALSDRQL